LCWAFAELPPMRVPPPTSDLSQKRIRHGRGAWIDITSTTAPGAASRST
jgi:hypothetical protein